MTDSEALESLKAATNHLESKCTGLILSDCYDCPYLDKARLDGIDTCMNIAYSDEIDFTIRVLETANDNR